MGFGPESIQTFFDLMQQPKSIFLRKDGHSTFRVGCNPSPPREMASTSSEEDEKRFQRVNHIKHLQWKV